MSKAVAYAVMKNGSAEMLAKPGNVTNSDWQPLYATDHAEELAKALEATNKELAYAMQLYKQDGEDWQKIMRMIADNAGTLSNYREATK